MKELAIEVKAKLAEAVELWASENLAGKPAKLRNAMYYNLETAMLKSIERIEKQF